MAATAWQWLYSPKTPDTWRTVARVVIKAAALFVLINAVFALADPLPALGRISGYNVVFKGRARLPYGENPRAAYNLSLYSLEAMFASHEIAGARGDEFRVVLIGDSSVWGILLRPGETLAGQINAGDYRAGGRPVRAYNLGYPTMSLFKDLLLLDRAIAYDPDLIVWLVTLESFDGAAQLDSALLQNNPDDARRLIADYALAQDRDDPRFSGAPSLWQRTIIGQRRALADWLRLQYYGAAWSITGVDQVYPVDYRPRSVDLANDDTWHGFRPGALAFDILAAGIRRAGDVPVLLVNEPIFISAGANHDVRYNAFYPRWAYDTYRARLSDLAAREGWALRDWWDMLPDAACYTDSPVHLTPACSAQLAARLGAAIAALP